MPKSESQKAAQRRYIERHREKMRELWRQNEEKRPPRDRAAYLREYRLRRKLEGRPVPGGSAYQRENKTESSDE